MVGGLGFFVNQHNVKDWNIKNSLPIDFSGSFPQGIIRSVVRQFFASFKICEAWLLLLKSVASFFINSLL